MNTAEHKTELATVLARWGLDFWGQRGDLRIAGSPERSALRAVVETADGRLLIIEKIPENSDGNKRRIAETIATLAADGLSCVLPYLETPDGELLPRIGDGHWQVRPFVRGQQLPRPEHAFDEWRGHAMAEFICALRRTAAQRPELAVSTPFSVLGYVRDLAARLETRASMFFPKIKRALAHVEATLGGEGGTMPVGFCHGDFHPLNILWQKRGIRAVIDWEFCGPKPELYDVALLIGCLGFEDPDALLADNVMAFLEDVRGNDVFAPASWAGLFDLVVAVRFGWLSEWFRHRDRDARKLEAVYMDLLLDNREPLQRAWTGTA